MEGWSFMGNNKKKSILIIHNEIPYPLTNGGNIRVFHLIKELSKYYKINLLTIPKERGYFNLNELKKYCNPTVATYFVEEFIKEPKFIQYFIKALYFKIERVISPFKSRLLKNHNYQTFCLRKELKNILRKKDFDYIQVEHSYLGYILNDINTKAKKILSFHNVHSCMINSAKEKRLIQKYERALSRKFNLAICCSKTDKNRIKKLAYKKTLIIPNGVDTKYYKMGPQDKPPSLLFMGDLTYKPNFKGVKYFFREIYPLIPQNISINIVGKYHKTKFKKEKRLTNVNFHGLVKDVRIYLKNTILICPLLDGGGTRFKILTAFSRGIPVVSTSKGAEGIECTNNKDIFIANNPKLFVKKINYLISNYGAYKKLRENARKLVEAQYDWIKVIKKFHKNLEES